MTLALPRQRTSSFAAMPGQALLALAIVAFLGLFLIWPVATVIFVAFTALSGWRELGPTRKYTGAWSSIVVDSGFDASASAQ